MVQSSQIQIEVRTKSLVSLVCFLYVCTPFRTILAPVVQFPRSSRLPKVQTLRAGTSFKHKRTLLVPLLWQSWELGLLGLHEGVGPPHLHLAHALFQLHHVYDVNGPCLHGLKVQRPVHFCHTSTHALVVFTFSINPHVLLLFFPLHLLALTPPNHPDSFPSLLSLFSVLAMSY